jgi:hypothetical protein
MSDRELLELAARAAGIDGAYFHSDNPIHCGIYQPRGEYYWNPLISDSEALRLAVKLRISITMSKYGRVVCRAGEWTRSIEPYGDDPQAAVRRAITCAAAAISKATMPEQTSTGARKGEGSAA